jgi:hypothetical protein
MHPIPYGATCIDLRTRERGELVTFGRGYVTLRSKWTGRIFTVPWKHLLPVSGRYQAAFRSITKERQ